MQFPRVLAVALLPFAAAVSSSAPPDRECAVSHSVFEKYSYSCAEISLLTPQERAVGESTNVPPPAVDFIRAVTPRFLAGNRLPAADRGFTYLAAYPAQIADDPRVRIAADLEPPVLEASHLDTLHPVFRITNNTEGLSTYFEFDSSPSFTSPSVARFPSLIPAPDGSDLISPLGSRLLLFAANHDVTPVTTSLQAPFSLAVFFNQRVAARTTFHDLAQVAQLLAIGKVDRRQLIEDTFRYVTHSFLWGDDGYMRTPLETFTSSVAECGNINALLGALLESQGIRHRLVFGFNPLARSVYPGGGHSAIELWHEGRWHYADSYLGVLAWGVAAEELADSSWQDRPVFQISDAGLRAAGMGDFLTLGQLFRYRIYGDFRYRAPLRTMIALRGNEEDYGKQWPLRKLEEAEVLDIARDLPEQARIYVRARFVRSKCTVGFRNLCGDPNAKASEWAHYDFAVPRSALEKPAVMPGPAPEGPWP